MKQGVLQARRVLAARVWLSAPVSPLVQAVALVSLSGVGAGLVVSCLTASAGPVARWRDLCLMFGLFSGLSALFPMATGGFNRRLGVVAAGVLGVCLGLTGLFSSPAGRALALVAALLGILAGQGAQALGAMLVRLDRPTSPQEVEAVATRWFLRLQVDAPNAFDWAGFDRWIRADRHHREAYEWVEGLWFSQDVGQARPMRRSRTDLLGLVGLGGPAGQIRMTMMVAGVCLAVVGAYG